MDGIACIYIDSIANKKNYSCACAKIVLVFNSIVCMYCLF